MTTLPITKAKSSLPPIANNDLMAIDPTIAESILQGTEYLGQRPVDERHALRLAFQMEEGNFLDETQLAFGRLDHKLFLVNGRHRLHGVSLSGCTVKFRAVIYDCATRAELDKLYTRFDTAQKSRTAGHLVDALGLTDDELRRTTAKIIYDASPLLMVRFEKIAAWQRPVETTIVEKRIEFIRPWKPEALLYQECLDKGIWKYTTRFRKAGVVAVALATLKHQPVLAKEFWMHAIDRDGLRSGDPRLALSTELATRETAGGEHGLAYLAATAWSAFYEKRPLKLLTIRGEAPITIAGTPYKHGR